MGIFQKSVVCLVEYRNILLPIVLTAFFLHLFLSRPSLGFYSTLSFDREPLLRAYYGPENFEEPRHLEPIKLSNLFHGDDFKSISDVHSKGLMHLGNLMFITDVDGMFLIIRRHPEMITCPGAWGLVGEHFAFDEKVEESVKRGISEELGSSLVDEVTIIENIFHEPLYYLKDYPNIDVKKDRQITYVMHVKLGKKNKKLNIKFSEEAIGHKWISMDDFLGWLRHDMMKKKDFDFCDEEYQQLILKSLTELGKIATNNSVSQ